MRRPRSWAAAVGSVQPEAPVVVGSVQSEAAMVIGSGQSKVIAVDGSVQAEEQGQLSVEGSAAGEAAEHSTGLRIGLRTMGLAPQADCARVEQNSAPLPSRKMALELVLMPGGRAEPAWLSRLPGWQGVRRWPFGHRGLYAWN